VCTNNDEDKPTLSWIKSKLVYHEFWVFALTRTGKLIIGLLIAMFIAVSLLIHFFGG